MKANLFVFTMCAGLCACPLPQDPDWIDCTYAGKDYAAKYQLTSNCWEGTSDLIISGVIPHATKAAGVQIDTVNGLHRQMQGSLEHKEECKLTVSDLATGTTCDFHAPTGPGSEPLECRHANPEYNHCTFEMMAPPGLTRKIPT